eukprot:UN00609
MSRPAAVSKVALKVAKALNPKPLHNEQRRAMSLKIEKTKKFDNRIITTNRPLLGHEQSQFATEFRKQRKEAWNKMVKEAVDRETNFATGQANAVEKSKLPPVYPFTPHAVNPYTGDYVVRPGTRTEGVIDLDTTLSSQILDYKRRIVNSRNKFRNTDLVVGDASVHQSRIDSNTERMNVLFDDTMRPFLNRRTRVSPIYHDTTLERRMPRTPLPADTVTGLSPTAGVLHAYRMHWVRMYLADKKRRKVWEKIFHLKMFIILILPFH